RLWSLPVKLTFPGLHPQTMSELPATASNAVRAPPAPISRKFLLLAELLTRTLDLPPILPTVTKSELRTPQEIFLHILRLPARPLPLRPIRRHRQSPSPTRRTAQPFRARSRRRRPLQTMSESLAFNSNSTAPTSAPKVQPLRIQ